MSENIENKNILINRITGEIYENRKQAKEILGHANFNRMLKNGEIYFKVKLFNPTDIIL